MKKLCAFLLCLALTMPVAGFAATGSHRSTAKHARAKRAPKKGIPCNDGTVSHAKHRQGSCSHHGGDKK